MDKILKPGIVLCIVCVVAATVLSIAYKTTYPLIQEQEEDAKSVAMQEVLADATSFEELDASSSEYVSSCFVGKNGDEIVGYAIFTDPTSGYSGEINMLTGVDTEGKVTGISIITHEETPGLGANATEPEFRNQFVGKSGSLAVTKNEPAGDNEILAMTSATITTSAVTDGVNMALEFYASDIAGTGAGSTTTESEDAVEVTTVTPEEAMLLVGLDATSFEEVDGDSDDISTYTAKNGEDVVGYVVFSYADGYVGPIEVVTGIDMSGTVTGVYVLSQEETSGLGSLIIEEDFTDQYIGKSGHLEVTTQDVSSENEIASVASATISSVAVTDSVNTALDLYESDLKEAK